MCSPLRILIRLNEYTNTSSCKCYCRCYTAAVHNFLSFTFCCCPIFVSFTTSVYLLLWVVGKNIGIFIGNSVFHFILPDIHLLFLQFQSILHVNFAHPSLKAIDILRIHSAYDTSGETVSNLTKSLNAEWIYLITQPTWQIQTKLFNLNFHCFTHRKRFTDFSRNIVLKQKTHSLQLNCGLQTKIDQIKKIIDNCG